MVNILKKESTNTTQNIKSFEMVKIKQFNPLTQNYIIKDILKINDKELISALYQVIRSSELYDPIPQLLLENIFVKIPRIKAWIDENCGHQAYEKMKHLFTFLKNYFKDEFVRIDNMINDDSCDFDTLIFAFPKGKEVVFKNRDQEIGGIITNGHYTNYAFVLSIEVYICMHDGHYYKVQETVSIYGFDGTKKISELSVRFLDDKTKEQLQIRGKRYRELTESAKYVMYHGNALDRTGFGSEYNINGRVMLDIVNYHKYRPNSSYYKVNSSNSERCHFIPNEKLFSCWAFIPGYVLYGTKVWVEFRVDNICDIIYCDNAFNHLVIPEDADKKLLMFTSTTGTPLGSRKDLILALIKNRHNTFKDVISNKSGGLIFLLHGPPGVGKTLTAEATAEVLHVPLYHVTVGELGNDINALEHNLAKAIELAQTWNAVLLLDEADIFVEKRNTNDINRNCMVAIFLRLLEYHNGVIFMTTNRVKIIDDAIESRISMIFNYGNLDKNVRKQIWKNLTNETLLEINDNDIDKLSDYKLNGRQIKNTIKLSQSLAFHLNEKPTIRHIEHIINLEMSGFSNKN